MDSWFILLEKHKKLVEYISNFCNKVNFGQNIFTLTDLCVCFIIQNGRLFCRDIIEELLLKTIKLSNITIGNKTGAKMNHLDPACLKNLSLQGKLSLYFFIVFTSGSRHLEGCVHYIFASLFFTSKREHY